MSNDDILWNTIASYSGVSWDAAVAEVKTFDLNNATSYRYVRITMTKNDEDSNIEAITEIGMYVAATTCVGLVTRDENGHTTVISPHDFKNLPKEAIVAVKEDSHDLAWTYSSRKDGKTLTVNMFKALRDLEVLLGTKYLYITSPDGKDISRSKLLALEFSTVQQLTARVKVLEKRLSDLEKSIGGGV